MSAAAASSSPFGPAAAAVDPPTSQLTAAISSSLDATLSPSSQETSSSFDSLDEDEEMQAADDASQMDALVEDIYEELDKYRDQLLELITDEETVDAIFDALNAFRPHFALVLASLPPEAFPIDPVLVARSGFEGMVREMLRQWSEAL